MEEKELELEHKYLKKVLKELTLQKKYKQGELAIFAKQKREFSLHFADDFYTMDDEEALGEGDMLNELDTAITITQKGIDRLSRQEFSPYFGRIDFKEKGKRRAIPYYIGVNALVKDGADVPMVCDWRAPVSSLFYDYELGDASYNAPDGVTTGSIDVKRQYEIKNKQLLKSFDSALTIGDDILKDVLSAKASKKMKTIVSTIQKEQNKIIRNATANNMLVQGVAGSGKTSIALHRIAYLLYQNQKTLKAEDILILSPNTLFSEYISEVLPELGEENMSQMSFYKLAKDELSFLRVGIESREENLATLTCDAKRLNQVAYKNTYEFYESLKTFCEKYFNTAFVPKDLKFGKDVIKASEILKLYNQTYVTKSPAIRVEWIVDYIIDKLNITTAVQEIAERLKRIIYPFFVEANILNIYADFLANIGMSFNLNKNKNIPYDDLAPLLYIVNYFMGLKKRKEVKYLIIDEMQDYSFVHYSIFNNIFDCNKTILGDINQCIEKIMTKDDLLKLKNMLNADYIELNKAYRSTYEIIDFANKIKNIECDKVERHGVKPQIIAVNNNFEEKIKNIINNSEHNSIAILTKSKKEAQEVYMGLSGIEEVSLVLSGEDESDRISIMPSYVAKGLEFDVVIIPKYNSKNYKTFLDNNLLYVSCTRALHELYLLN